MGSSPTSSAGRSQLLSVTTLTVDTRYPPAEPHRLVCVLRRTQPRRRRTGHRALSRSGPPLLHLNDELVVRLAAVDDLDGESRPARLNPLRQVPGRVRVDVLPVVQ